MLLISLCIILVLAVYWEYKDYKRLYARPMLKEIKDPKKKEKEMKFYACFNYENAVLWRMMFVVAFLSCILIKFILKSFGTEIKSDIFIIMLAIIFLIQYFASDFKNFHLYRLMAYKVQNKKYL